MKLTTYIFDLDETLYPINQESLNRRVHYYTQTIQEQLNIESYEEAQEIGHQFYKKYGTTYAGLVAETGISFEEFHSFSKKWDYTEFHEEDKELEELIKKLEGKKYIYSAGHKDHVEKVLDAIGVDINIFDGVFSNDDGNTLNPKPQKPTQEIFIDKYNIDKSTIIFLDDSLSCIKSSHEDGWNKCILVNHGKKIDTYHEQTPSVKEYLRSII